MSRKLSDAAKRQRKVPPLADISIEGRALEGGRRQIKGLIWQLRQVLSAEIETHAEQIANERLFKVRDTLDIASEHFLRAIQAIPDPAIAQRVLRGAYQMLGAYADALSRAERVFIPRKIKPQIEKATRKASGGPGGRKSGENRRKVAEATWKKDALKEAKEIRKKQPGITQVDLADAIAKKVRCPETQVILSIRDWEKSGTLARRSK